MATTGRSWRSLPDDDLLRGEDPLTTDVRDARTWVSVYEQLARGHRQLGRPTDRLTIVEARLAFWRRRLGELSERNRAQ